MESCVYVVVVCACIRGIFHFEVFYEDEVFDDLDSLDLTVSTEKVTDCGVVCVLHSWYVQLPHQDALVYVFRRLGLFSQLLFLWLGQAHVLLMNGSIKIYGVVSDSQSDLVLCLLLLPFLLVSSLSTTTPWPIMMFLIPSLGFIVIMTIRTSMSPFFIRPGVRSAPMMPLNIPVSMPISISVSIPISVSDISFPFALVTHHKINLFIHHIQAHIN